MGLCLIADHYVCGIDEILLPLQLRPLNHSVLIDFAVVLFGSY